MQSTLMSLMIAASALLTSSTLAQHIFINQVPEYYSLGSCAEPPLSTIVRDMYSGCGDGSQTTSYACFCSESSSHFAKLISNVIISSCPASIGQAQATTAQDVFHSYCQLGDSIGSKTTTATASATSSSTSAADSASSSQTGMSIGARVAIAIIVPLVILAGGIAVFWIMRRRSILRRNGEKILPPPPPPYSHPGVAEVDSTEFGSYKSELPAGNVMTDNGEKQQIMSVKNKEMYPLDPPIELPDRTSSLVNAVELSARRSMLVELA